MATYVPPKRATAFIIYVGLEDQANAGLFKANPTLASGDFKVSKDGGALANLTDLPTVTPASGKMVKITLTSTEMTADNVTVVCSDAAGAEWYDLIINIATAANQIDDIKTDTAAILADTGTDGVVIVDGGITAAKIASDAITAAKIATDAITAAKIAADAIGASELAADAVTEIVDGLLKRDMSAVTGESARSPLNALRQLRNKVAIDTGVLTVYKEDDTTAAWTADVVGTTGADPVTSVDPT